MKNQNMMVNQTKATNVLAILRVQRCVLNQYVAYIPIVAILKETIRYDFPITLQ